MAATITNHGYISTSSSRSITDLLLGIGDGDPAVWDEIMHRYGKLIASTVRSFRLQDADAHDAVQTTWLQLAEHAHQIREPERLGSSLITTARRACLQILRQTKPTFHNFDVVAETVVGLSEGPEQRVVDADTARILWSCVSELSPRQQILLRALFTDNPVPYTRVARIYQMPTGGIGPTRARALAQLRAGLERRQVGEEARQTYQKER